MTLNSAQVMIVMGSRPGDESLKVSRTFSFCSLWSRVSWPLGYTGVKQSVEACMRRNTVKALGFLLVTLKLLFCWKEYTA